MREKSRDFLNNKRSPQEQEIAAQTNEKEEPSRMGKIMDMIYANSQCASIYYQVFDMAKIGDQVASVMDTERKRSMHDLSNFGEYMYVEMAHYTDDDTVVLICVSNNN